MSILLHFIFGFFFSFTGSITPSMLNMTALKISLEKNHREANFYSLGVSLIVSVQAFIAIILTKYITENPNILENLEKAGTVIFILLSIYFYKQSKKQKQQEKASNDRKGNSFLSGILLSMLNMFSIPFFCGITASLELFNLMSFDKLPVTFFIIGSTIGTFCILFLYGKYANFIQKKTGKLTKSNINNRGYNKYLKMDGEVSITLDYEKFEEDEKWDGLKGYITNSKLSKKRIVDHYHNLWHIEKAFRMSKTDLRIRPIYRRLKHRIEAHICISFTAYSIYKELERVLLKEKSSLSIERAAELTHNMYKINYTLPESKQTKSLLLKMDDEQAELHQIIQKNY